MRLLHDGATYAQALESRIEREIEEQRQAEEAAALAKAKPKGPPAHLVGTEARRPKLRPRPSARAGQVVRSRSLRPRLDPGVIVDLYPGYQLDGGAFAWESGIFPPPKSPFPPIAPWPGGVRRSEPTSAGQCGPPTPGRKPNAWRRRSRLAWTFRPSASRQGSF